MADAEDFSVGFNAWCLMTHPKSSTYHYYSTNPNPSLGSSYLVPVTSGNVLRSLNVPTVNSYFTPDQLKAVAANGSVHREAKSSIRGGFGTYTYQGSVEFEMTNGMTNLLDVNSGNEYGSFFRRNSIFHLRFYDGKQTCTVMNCVWSDFSISGSPGSAVTVNIGYQSNNGYKDNLDIRNGMIGGATFNSEDFLLPYWRSGGSEILDFTIAMNRSVTPVYLNNTFTTPSYLKVGLMTVSLQMTCMKYKTFSQGGTYSIHIGGKKITLNNRILQSSDYHMTSLSDVGQKSYSWTSLSDSNNTMPVFTIDDLGEEYQEPVEK